MSEDFTRQAERAASSILAEHGFPNTHALMHALLTYAYAQGARDELVAEAERIEKGKTRLLDVLGGDAA